MFQVVNVKEIVSVLRFSQLRISYLAEVDGNEI